VEVSADRYGPRRTARAGSQDRSVPLTTPSHKPNSRRFGDGRCRCSDPGGLSRRVNLCCVFSNLNGDARRIYGSLSWFGQRRPYVQRGEYCISLHLSVCVGVTSCERGKRSQVSRKGKKSILLEMLILEVERCLVVFILCPPPRRVPCLLFYRVK
jgi:hypothetical protein